MTNLQTGRAWSDERRKVRIKMRTAIDRIEATTPSHVLNRAEILLAVLEVAVAHFAWGADQRVSASEISRLAYRIRLGEALEL